MKTKTLFMLFIAFIFAANMTATERNFYQNIIHKETKVTETIIMDKENKTPQAKSISEKNELGQLITKTTYKWDRRDGWQPHKKYQYSYNSTDAIKLAKIKYTIWNHYTGCWEKEIQVNY